MGEERLKIVLKPLPYKVPIFQLLWSKLINSDLSEYIKHKRYGWTFGQESLWTETKSLNEVLLTMFKCMTYYCFRSLVYEPT